MSQKPEEVGKHTIENIKESDKKSLEDLIFSKLGRKIGDLTQEINEANNIDIVTVSRSIYRAREENKLRLVDQNPPSSLLGFLRPTYNIWFWLVLLCMGLMIYSVYLMPQIYPLIYIRFAVGTIFDLYVPGFTLLEALYPEKNGALSRLERFVLGIGTSLVLVPLTGMVLSFTPIGITVDSLMISMLVMTMVITFAAVIRKYGSWKTSRARDHLKERWYSR